jgi:hypothetical protein
MASGISVRYQSIPLPDWFSLFRFLTGSGICICNNSGTGLSGCREFRPSGIPAFKTKLSQGQKRCTLRIQAAGSRKESALHVLTWLLLV